MLSSADIIGKTFHHLVPLLPSTLNSPLLQISIQGEVTVNVLLPLFEAASNVIYIFKAPIYQ